MIINQTDSATLVKARDILIDHRDHLGPNVQTQQALRIKIMAIDITLNEREKETA